MKSTTSEDSRKTLAARAPWESEAQGKAADRGWRRGSVSQGRRENEMENARAPGPAGRSRDGQNSPWGEILTPRRCACRGGTVGEHATAVWG